MEEQNQGTRLLAWYLCLFFSLLLTSGIPNDDIQMSVFCTLVLAFFIKISIDVITLAHETINVCLTHILNAYILIKIANLVFTEKIFLIVKVIIFIVWCVCMISVLFPKLVESIKYVLGNKEDILKEYEEIGMQYTEQLDLHKYHKVFDELKKSKHFKNLGESFCNQINRAEYILNLLKTEIDSRFKSGSMSWDRYIDAHDKIELFLLGSYKNAEERVKSFPNSEVYASIKKLDDKIIPKNLQIEQLDFIKSNLADLEGILIQNEQLLIEANNLLNTLDKSELDKQEELNSLLAEIKTKTDEVKYYN